MRNAVSYIYAIVLRAASSAIPLTAEQTELD